MSLTPSPRRAAAVRAAAVAAAATLSAALARADTTTTYTGPNDGSYSNHAYWTGGVVPSNGNNGSNYSVVIGSAADPNVTVQTQSDISPTIDNLTINTGSSLQLGGNQNLTIVGTSVVDNGSIVLNYNQYYAATLQFNANTALSGTGTLILDSSGGNATVTTGTGDVLTQAAGHTISGLGVVSANLSNAGTVNANYNGSTLYLRGPTVNTGTIEGTAGGTLQIDSGIVVNNAGGTVLANGGTDFLNGATISGGTVRTTTAAGSGFYAQNGVFAGGVTVASGSTVNVYGNSDLSITGSALTNNGTIVVNNNQYYTGTMTANGNVAVGGTGTITLDTGGGGSQLNTGAGYTLTLGSGQTVDGDGQVNATTVNQGTIVADVAGQTLTISSATANNVSGYSLVNTGTLKATAGTLQVNNGATVNNAGGTILAAGGTVQLYGVTVNGGTLTGTGGGSITVQNTTFTGGPTLSTGTTVNLNGNTNLNVAGPTLANNGTIVVNNNQYYTGVLTFTSSTTVTGTGTINLDTGGGGSQVNTTAGATLTLAAGQTVNGLGQVNAAFVNNGTVNANVAGQALYVYTNGGTNNATMEATNNGTLYVGGVTITQGTAGVIQAVGVNSSSPSVVEFNQATLSGGTLTSSGGGYVIADNSTFTGNPTITAGTLVDVDGNTNLTLTGTTLTNNGHIVLNDNQYYGSTFQVNSNLTLAGTGTLTLDSNGTNAYVASGTNAASVPYTLTQVSTHTIDGYGQINAQFVNNGTVNADVPNTGNVQLTISGYGTTNNATMEATNGGTLYIVSTTVTQGTAGVIQATGASGGTSPIASAVSINGSTIVGGTLAGSATDIFTIDNSTLTGSPTIAAGTRVNVDGNTNLTVTGTTLTDNGHIVLNDNQYYGSTFQVNSNLTLAGTGTLTLDSNGTNAYVASGTNSSNGVYTLTQAAGHTIDGYGQINAQFVNNGTVDADVAGQSLTISGYGTTNNATLEATNGGTLYIVSTTVTQGANGVIQATGNSGGTSPTASTISINSATISGGTLAGSATDFVTANNSTFTGGLTIATGTLVNVNGNTNLTVTGSTLTDNGHIVLNNNQYYGSTFQVNSNLTLAGTGTLTLDSNGGNAQLDAGTGYTLTQGQGHTIDGLGLINAPLVNNGIVSGDVNGQTLTVNGATTNYGLFLATNGGTLSVASGVLTNLVGTTLTAGGYEADANSTLIIPGTVTNNAAGVELNGPNSTFAAIAPIAVNSGSFSLLNGRTFTTVGALANSGTVVVGYGGSALTVSGNYTQTAGLTTADGTLTITGSTTVSGGQLLFGATQGSTRLARPLNALSVSGTGTVTLAPSASTATRTVLTVASLTFGGTTAAPTGKVDVGNGDVIVHNGSLTALTAAAAEGFASGTWNGTGGLVSASANADAKHLTGVGVVSNAVTGYTTFDGQPAVSTDVLVRYTYYGDTNLDGVVNAADYTRIDAGFVNHLTGWANGDFNYDGTVDGTDYALMDNAFNQQTNAIGTPAAVVADMAAAPAAVVAVSAVPEPAVAGLAAVAGLLLGRRRSVRARRA